MAPLEAASLRWFVVFMQLPDAGLLPTVTPTEYLPSRPALAQFFGPKYGSGYVFENHGDADYEEYVKTLYSRVLQLRWPVNGVVSFHFARALLAEAMHLDVNWAEFGFKSTHPHQSRTRIPRVLPEFEDLQSPLDPLTKIVPRIPFEVSYRILNSRTSSFFLWQHLHLQFCPLLIE